MYNEKKVKRDVRFGWIRLGKVSLGYLKWSICESMVNKLLNCWNIYFLLLMEVKNIKVKNLNNLRIENKRTVNKSFVFT